MDQRLIGVALSEVHSEDRLYFIRELNRLACEQGYRLMVFNTCTELVQKQPDDYSGDKAVYQLIPYELMAGMVIFPNHIYDEVITLQIVSECRIRRIPVITIDKALPDCVCLHFEYADVFSKLCNHVIQDHGARDVLMIAGMEGNDFSEERVTAFRKTLKQNGLSFDRSMVAYGDFWEGKARQVMIDWFEKEGREFPDAIICANDSMAIAASAYLQDHGCRVPEDCIVTGFDGTAQSERCFPRLTTCRQNNTEMAERILETISAISEGRECPVRQSIGFEIMHSQSCGCKSFRFDNVHKMFYDTLWQLNRTQERQHFLCKVQMSLTNLSNLSDLCKALINAFIFPTCVVGVNPDFASAPDFGESHRDNTAFSNEMQVTFQRYAWMEDSPCLVEKNKFIPHLDKMLERKEPIIVCTLHYLEVVMGYCVFQTEVTQDAYENLLVFMNSANASLGIYRSKQQLSAMNSELESLYVHDHLTGLYNRRGFYREFDLIRYKADSESSVLLISADLDGLKHINDTFGHSEGDNAISTVGHTLAATADSGEICARFGGDEFAVIGIVKYGTENDCFENFKKRFSVNLEKYNQTYGKPYQVEASLGFCAALLTENFDLDELMKKADNAMYADKIARKKARMT